jgi:two-component system chemotaxis sensor kinase CheA
VVDLDINQYIDVFVEEAKEHLQSLNDSLLELEKDITNQSFINEIFRIAHTLKGMAGTMGFENMANLTHEMENVLDAVRSEKIILNENIIDIIFECFDVLDYSINVIATTGKEDNNDYGLLIDKLKNILGDNGKPNAQKYQKSQEIGLDQYVLNILDEARKRELSSYKIHIKLNSQCMLKSARAFVIFNTLENLGEIVYSNPPVEDIEDEKFDLDFTIIFISKINEKELKVELNNISEIDTIDIETIIVEENNTEILDRKVEEKSANNLIPQLEKEEKKNVINKDRKVGKTVRVDIDRLDNLMNLVSELIIIKTRMDDLSGSSNKENMTEAIEYLERITTSLHDAVMKVRMVPIEKIFNRFPRMVRDLSKELNKEIRLEMSGEETEVDRTVIDEIGDPLIHIIRNSIDHGIETPENRIKQGKPKEGTVILKAYPDGNNVVIEVIDDGGGINVNEVKEKAISKGIVTEEEAEMFSSEDIVNLLFLPGFSTSEEVSDVSGRGVGLDVVKSKIEAINGSVEIISEIKYKKTLLSGDFNDTNI